MLASTLALGGLALLPVVPWQEAQDAPEELLDADELDALLAWRTGEIPLGDGIATLHLPDGFRYLPPEQTKGVLEEIWGNPPRDLTLGMIFPADQGPFDEDSWAVVLDYEEDGHVSDDDASEIDYDGLLSDMQASLREENVERSRAGFGTLDIVGWAARPHYDSDAHRLYWAKELRFEGAPATSLNYDVRTLGRKGVRSMNAVADMDALEEVEQGMSGLLTKVEFTAGNRYEDFDSSIDDLAVYGLGGLIAGKLALKAGLFKVLLGALVAGKKLVIAVLAGIGALFAKAFKRRSAQPAE